MTDITKHLSKKEIGEFPVGKFEGKIVLVETKNDLKEALSALSKERVLGFDTESKPTFKKGEYNPVCLVQLSTPDTAYLIRISKTGFTAGLASLFEDRTIIKVGVAIRDDLIDLKKIRMFSPASFIEISEVTSEMGIVNAGVKGLAAIFLGFRVSKAQQTSDWSANKLTQYQLDYAATDAWVCLKIYQRILKLEEGIG